MSRRGWLAVVLLVACGDDGGAPSDDASSSGSTTFGSTTSTTSTSAGPGTGSASTGDEGGPLEADAGESRYAFIGETVVLDGSGSTGASTYQWNLDDGTAPAPAGVEPTAQVVYDQPGRYRPVLTVFDEAGLSRSDQVTITVTAVPTHVPRHTTTIAREDDDSAVYVVVPDANVLTVLTPDTDVYAVNHRWGTCDTPRTVAVIPGEVAVACQGDDTLALIDPGTGQTRSLALPRASRPYGVIATEDRLWVTLQATGELAEVDPSGTDPVLVARHPALPDARGLGLLPDGRIAVTRWRSPDEGGHITVFDPSQATSERFSLSFDDKESSDTEAGGVPSYLDAVVVSPIGDRAAIPSLQANIAQGLYVSDEPLTFETTLRGVVSFLDLSGSSPVEVFEERKHFDDRGFMAAATYSSRGDYLFALARGGRSVERLDTFNNAQSGAIIDVGYAPSGLVLDADDTRLFVDVALSREVVVYDVSDFGDPVELIRLPSVDVEPLPAAVLRGKQLFNDSFDPRLAQDGYMACAHCHLDGEADHRTWDFTDRGEGLRNTISLLGRGADYGPIHWSANFDEVQDFEHDIRGPFGGVGLLDDNDWQSGTVDQTLGDPKAGLSADLDALAAYVESLTEPPRSPFRDPDGSLTPDALAGQTIFESVQAGCTTCHIGPTFSDSAFDMMGQPLLHDVGTIGPGSGQRLGQPLPGLDTPTLRGLWNGAPYLHDGSAPTVMDVLTTANPSDSHGTTSTLTPTELAQLEAYLLSL